MDSTCQNCYQNSIMIQKYQRIIQLLRIKERKASCLNIKKHSKDLIVENTQESSLSSLEDIQASSNLLQLSNNQVNIIQNYYLLSLLILTNRPKKALLKSSFNQILQFASSHPKNKRQEQKMLKLIPLSNQKNIETILQETLNQGKNIKESQNNINMINVKQLHNQIFCLELKNQKSDIIIFKLQKQFNEMQKRFLKQTQKKKESLEIISQQLKEKSDQIVQFQQIIRKYEKIIGRRIQNSTQNLLIEDQEQIKKTNIRLQNINEKLNQDLRIANEKNKQLLNQIQNIKIQNKKLKQQNNQLRQNNFQILAQENNNKKLNEIYTNLSQKLNKKIQGLKKYEKQINFSTAKSLKCLTMLGSTDNCRNKNNQISLLLPLSSQELSNQQKIQQIFSFLFNIQNENHQISNQSLFDDDELSLLKNHKLTFINNLNPSMPITLRMKSQKIFKKKQIAETDQVFYINSNKCVQNISFFNVLEEGQMQIKNNSNQNNMKLIQMQIQKNNLIEKISQLKNTNFHVRNVILNFLKTCDLNLTNKQCTNILDIIFDLFEYSEQQKINIFKQKKTKSFWSIL